jgi:CAAX prenyl protease-like protein
MPGRGLVDPALWHNRHRDPVPLRLELEGPKGRGWLMRWLIRGDFQSVPLGAYTRSSFWITALLFASEHGPFWEVGLAAGVAYNWWMVRTKSLGDCIVAHAVTNAVLSAYVVFTDRWEYWS